MCILIFHNYYYNTKYLCRRAEGMTWGPFLISFEGLFIVTIDFVVVNLHSLDRILLQNK